MTDTRPLPSWFDDAKLGIMITWGLYSVPAWAPLDDRLVKLLAEHGDGADKDRTFGATLDEDGFDPIVTTSYSEWYLNSLSVEGSPTWKHHQATYGDAPYADFRAPFAAAVSGWSPGPWAELCAAAGAKYVVPLAKHHDGFLMWPSRTPNPFNEDYALERDLLGELKNAVEEKDIRFGLYYSGGIDWTFANLPVLTADEVAGSVPDSAEYAAYADAHWRELIERYEPAVLWNDIGYPPAAEPEKLFADYYTKVPDGLVNERFYAGTPDFTTPEYASRATADGPKWETVRGVGLSFGYNTQEDAAKTMSAPELVALLMDVVSKGGNLLLGVGPDAAGRISAVQEESLRGLGVWLAVNGEAVYGTRPWSTQEEDSLRFTISGGDLFVTDLAGGKNVPDLSYAPDTTFTWLSTDPDMPSVLKVSPAP